MQNVGLIGYCLGNSFLFQNCVDIYTVKEFISVSRSAHLLDADWSNQIANRRLDQDPGYAI